MRGTVSSFFCFLLLVVGCAGQVLAQVPPGPYRKAQIANARFGDAERQSYLALAQQVSANIAKTVIGQERAAGALESRLIQYVSEFGMPRREPHALHLIGMPGTGKTAMLKAIEALGFTVYRVQAEQFVGSPWSEHQIDSLQTTLRAAAYHSISRPVILAFEEIDKIRELQPVLRGGAEQTSPLIGGYLNPILDEGRHGNFDLTNVLVVTTMNLPAEELEEFSKEVLGEMKSFFEFQIKDFESFDAWLRSRSHATPRILSKLFRPNTVSRIAQNAELMLPLGKDSFRAIVESNARQVVARWTESVPGRRLTVTLEPSVIDFLAERTVNPSLGARATVQSVQLLVGQLVNLGEKLRDDVNQSDTRAIPREIAISASQDGKVTVTVTPVRVHSGQVVRLSPFSVTVALPRGSTGLAIPSDRLESAAPPLVSRESSDAEPRLTKKMLAEQRYPKLSREFRGLAKKLGETVYGQEEAAKALEAGLTAFASRNPDAQPYRPQFVVFAGFPGIGKSALVRAAGAATGLPIARINMQGYSSDDPEIGEKLKTAILSEVLDARRNIADPNERVILAIEELDKVFEVSPQTGEFQNRPALNILKDILDGGLHEPGFDRILSRTFIVITMNFGVERFGFSPDPRITPIEEVMSAWEKLSKSPTDRRAVLSSLFLPETVNRIFDKTLILKPLDQDSYDRVIEKTVTAFAAERLGVGTTLKLTPKYRRYLTTESVIPSEGARNTENAVRRILSRDLEAALRAMGSKEELRTQPVTLELDFLDGKSEVKFRAITQDGERTQLGTLAVARAYPPLDFNRGRMPRERLETAVHEFGHAYTQMLFGGRIRWATVVSFEQGVGGAVFPTRSAFSAEAMLRSVYMALGSRAMERVMLMDDPLSDSARLRLPAGSTADLQMATRSLFNVIYTLGVNPSGATMERTGVDGPSRYANFSDLPPDQVEALGMILRAMEDSLVKRLAAAHPREWYVEKIEAFARAGGMDEAQFRALLDLPPAGEPGHDLAVRQTVDELFDRSVEKEDATVRRARAHRHTADAMTAEERWAQVREETSGLIKQWLKAPRAKCNDALTERPGEGG